MKAFSQHFALKASLYSWMIVFPFSVALSNLTLSICSILLLLLIIKNAPSSWKEILLFPGIILFGLFVISIVTSENKWKALAEIKHNIPLVLSSIVVYFCFKVTPEYLKKCLKILMLSTFIAFFLSGFFNILPFHIALKIHGYFNNILQPFEESNHDLFGWYIPFMVRIQFGNLLSFLAIVSSVLGILEKRSFWWITSLVLIIMVLVIGVRGSMLGLLFAGISLGIYVIKERILIPFKPAFAFGILVLLLPILFYTYQKINARWNQTKFEIESFQNGSFTNYEYQHYSLLTRLVSWKNGYQLWKKNPVLGTGIGDYKKEYSLNYEDDTLKVPLYYHSQWLYFLDVFGILGLLIFISSYIIWLSRFKIHKIRLLYGIMLTSYLAIIWIFDTGMLSQIDMMSFGFFTTLILCFKEN